MFQGSKVRPNRPKDKKIIKLTPEQRINVLNETGFLKIKNK